MILYFCPDADLKSAGMRILYRHVEILVKHGIDAAILHQRDGFRMKDMPDVPLRYAEAHGSVSHGDVVVAPEVFPQLIAAVRDSPVRRIIIALNWRFIYSHLQQGDYRHLNVERVLTQSAFIGDFVAWAMGLPAHVFVWGIKDSLYFEERAQKQMQIVFIGRKQEEMRELAAVLQSRNPDFFTRIRWVGLHGLDEPAYAEQIRRAQIFINLSKAEGLPCSLLEAMRCGTFVAGYNSVGGQRELIAEGPNQNCILAENLDYVTLAQRLEPLLADLLRGDVSNWEQVRANAQATSRAYTREEEERTVLKMWRMILAT